MDCINKIVTLGACPDEEVSLSGFQLIKAAGISSKILSDVANDTYTQGSKLAMDKKAIAITKLKNDFLSALQTNGIAPNISNPVYETTVFNINSNVGSSISGRGVKIHKASYRGSLRKTYIKSVQCYPLESGSGQIVVVLHRNGFNTSYAWNVEFVANHLNIYDSDLLSDFPFEIPSDCKSVTVKAVANISFCSGVISCMKGCNGSLPNPCGWAEGWDGSRAVKSEAHGVNVEFYCMCDYDKIICDLAPSFSGELIYLKWQMEIFDEATKTDRFSNWVIYGKEDIVERIMPDLQRDYARKWNALMDGVMDILKTYRDECLNCKGKIRWVTNF